MPKFTQPWFDAFRSHRSEIVTLLFLIAATVWWGKLIDRRIHDRALAAWSPDWLQRREKWFNESVRQRKKVLVVLGIFFVSLTSLFICISNYFNLPLDVFALSLFFDLSLNTVALSLLLAFALAAFCAIYSPSLYMAVKFGKQTTGEKRGPALAIAHYMALLFSRPTQFVLQKITPHLFALALVVLAPVVLNRIAFDLLNSSGLVCDHSLRKNRELTTDRIRELPSEGVQIQITRNAYCDAAVFRKGEGITAYFYQYRIVVSDKYSYEIAIISEKPTNESNSPSSQPLTPVRDFIKFLLRRDLAAPASSVIAKVGSDGNEEYVVESFWRPTKIVPKRTGDLHFAINEAVIGVPGYYGHLYADRQGVLTVSIKAVPR